SGDDTRDHAQGIRIGGFGGADVPRVNNPNPPASTTEIVLRTYFPGTADEEQASAIELRPGANFGSADVAIMRMPARRIRGVIVNGVTRQPAGTAILRRARASAQTTCAASLNDADNCWWEIRDPGTGTFDITPVGPGSYILYAGFDDL